MGVNHKLIYGVNDFETWCKNNNRLDILEEWDVEKNNGLMPKDVFKSSQIKYFWKCKEGHNYELHTAERQRYGCPYCGHKKLLKGFNDLETWCKQNNKEYLLEEWDYLKNDKLPCEFFPFNRTKVWWVGKCGHSFYSAINNRSQGSMCSKCNREFKTSFPQQSIHYYIKKKYNDVINDFNLFGKEIDIYIPSLKIGIEYDGSFWHKDKKRDIEKNKLCEENDIILYRIREKNLPLFEETDFLKILYCDTDCSEENKVEIVVKELLKRLNLNDVNVSFIEDRMKIYSNFISNIKENSFGNIHPELIYLWDYKKNQGITPYFVLCHSKKKFWWVGECGHSWDMSVKQIVEGQRCPYCAGRRVLSGFNDLLTKFPDLVKKEWCFEKNIKKPNDIFYQSTSKYWFKCDKGHIYKTRLDNKVKLNSGCPYCEHRKLAEGETDLLSVRPDVERYWNYEKNKKKPSEVFSHTKEKYWFRCDKGHEFFTSPANLMKSKIGCKYCRGSKVLKGFNDFQTCFPKESKYWDYEKNNKKPNEVVKSSNTKYWFKCTKGHSFMRSPNELPKKVLCPYCANRKVLEGFNDLTTTMPQVLKYWDYEKNKIKPTEVHKGSHKKVWWIKNGESIKREIVDFCGCTEFKKSGKKYRQYKKVINLDTGEIFNSVTAATKSIGLKSTSDIPNSCKGKQKTAGGYHWAYYEEKE